MATITRIHPDAVAGDTTTPELVLGWEAEFEGGNVFHKLLGGAVVATLAAGGPRAGTLELLYDVADQTAAGHAHALHQLVGRFQLAGMERPWQNLTYAVDGRPRITLTPDAKRWVVRVPYQELLT